MSIFNRKTRAKKALSAVLKDTELPPLSGSVSRTLELLRDQDSSLDDVSTTMQRDPGLVMRVLKIVNSASFGLRRKVDSVPHAVHFMGRVNLESLVLGIAVQRALPTGRAEGFDHHKYLHVAVRRAMIAKDFAQHLHPASQAEDFAAALLQDMAIPLLAQARPEEYSAIMREWSASENAHIEEIEEAALGCHHGEIGALVGKAWGLPEGLVGSIRSHHSSDGETTPAVRLASLMRTKHGHGNQDELIEGARALGIEPDWSMQAIERAEGEASFMRRLMS